MTHFFSVYKTLEGKATALESVKGAQTAQQIISDCLCRYEKEFPSDSQPTQKT